MKTREFLPDIAWAPSASCVHGSAEPLLQHMLVDTEHLLDHLLVGLLELAVLAQGREVARDAVFRAILAY